MPSCLLSTTQHDVPGVVQMRLLWLVQKALRTSHTYMLVAGKTTLMDVLAGRKTAGKVQGDIRVQVDQG